MTLLPQSERPAARLRQSNMELFRIVAMFLVLVVHADFYACGTPTPARFLSSPGLVSGQYFFEALSIGCVNMFVLLSGWFGIRPRLRGLGQLIFQTLFISWGVCLVLLFSGQLPHGIKDIAKALFTASPFHENYWFIPAYMGLYLLAPVLNLFAEQATQQQFKRTLTGFFIFQTVFSWLIDATPFLDKGYSTLSFAGLYLLARYVRLYTPSWSRHHRTYDLLCFGGGVFCIWTVSMGSTFLAAHVHPAFLYLTARQYDYVNPTVIFLSLFLLLYFSKLRFSYSPWINRLGGSCLAVYLLHIQPHLFESVYLQHIANLSRQSSGIRFLAQVMLFLIAVFAAAILLDQVRLYLWQKIMQICQKITDRHQ